MTEIELAQQIGDALQGRTLATAESCTAGSVAQVFAATQGSMDWFRGGVIAYQSSVKRELLSVGPGSVVTEQAAREMARGAARLLHTDVAVSVTGVAGPESLDGVEPGVVMVGIAFGNEAESFTHHFVGEPTEICAQACHAALCDLALRLEVDDDA